MLNLFNPRSHDSLMTRIDTWSRSYDLHLCSRPAEKQVDRVLVLNADLRKSISTKLIRAAQQY